MDNKLHLLFKALPLSILILICCLSWGFILTNKQGVSYSINNIVALVLILLNLLSYIYMPSSWSALFTFVIIVLWTFGTIDVSHYTHLTSYRLKIGGLRLTTPAIDFRGLLLLTLFCFVQWKEIKKVIKLILNLIDYGQIKPINKSEK